MMSEARDRTYARLEEARQKLDAGATLPREDVGRILRDRAQALAKPLDEAPTPAETRELLVFSLAGERYGIATAHILEVVPLLEPTPVPGTPPFVLGVMNHRGRILPLLDLRQLFELGGQGVPAGGRVVAVEAGGMTFGIFAEAVAGTSRVASHKAAPPPATLTGDRRALIEGVTREMVAILDLEALARDPRIIVNDEVGR